MKNEDNMKNVLMNTAVNPPLEMKPRVLSLGLVLVCVLLSLLLAAFMAVSAVVLESHTYKRAARNDAYLAGVENAAVGIMTEAAKKNGLSKTMLIKHVQREDIHKLAKKNAADAALVLKGSQVIYGDSFNEAALETDIYKFYEMRLPEVDASNEQPSPQSTEATPQQETNGTESIGQQTAPSDETVGPIYAQDTAPLLGETEEDPEREALREQADELAAEISARIDDAVRVIDMEQVVYDYSDGTVIDWLRFMARGGVLLPLVLLAVMLLLLYRQVWQHGFSPWLAVVSFCSGAALLICAAIIPAKGWMHLSVEPVQLNILYTSVVHGLLAELLVMAVLWLAIGYIAVRSAIGKPLSIKWLKALFVRLRPTASGEDLSERRQRAENTMATNESFIGDSLSDTSADSSNNRSNPDLLQTIKKAAVESTNSLLGRKGR